MGRKPKDPNQKPKTPDEKIAEYMRKIEKAMRKKAEIGSSSGVSVKTPAANIPTRQKVLEKIDALAKEIKQIRKLVKRI